MRSLLLYLAILTGAAAFISGEIVLAELMFPAPDVAMAEAR